MGEDFSLIYIMGRGGSGSTILDLVLGAHESVAPVGELHPGWFRPHDRRRCSCGEKVQECAFWRKVLDDTYAQPDGLSPKEFGRAMRRLAGRSGFVRMLFSRNGEVSAGFERTTRAAYRSLVVHSGRPIVAESSKNFNRGWFLLRRFGERVRVIHLVRDGRGVVWSFMKRARNAKRYQGFWTDFRTAAWNIVAWNCANLAALALRRRYPQNVLMLRYEDLCRRPNRELHRLGDFLDLDLNRVVEQIRNGAPLPRHHIIYGNFAIMNAAEAVSFRAREDWKTDLPWWARPLFVVLGFPANAVLGYL